MILMAYTAAGRCVPVKVNENGEVVVSGSVSGSTGSDRELIVTVYFAKNAFTGASIGDTITSTQVIDVTAAPSTVSVIWRNQTTATDIATPSAADLTLLGSSAPLPAGAATAANQSTANTSLGTPADAVASTDTGTFSILAFIKRGLQTLTTLDSKLGTLTPAGRARVETLSLPGVSRQIAATAASGNTALTSTCRRITILARNANIRFSIGSSVQTALTSSHYIAQGERLDYAVPATPNIAVLRADSTDGVLEVSELVEP